MTDVRLSKRRRSLRRRSSWNVVLAINLVVSSINNMEFKYYHRRSISEFIIQPSKIYGLRNVQIITCKNAALRTGHCVNGP